MAVGVAAVLSTGCEALLDLPSDPRQVGDETRSTRDGALPDQDAAAAAAPASEGRETVALEPALTSGAEAAAAARGPEAGTDDHPDAGAADAGGLASPAADAAPPGDADEEAAQPPAATDPADDGLVEAARACPVDRGVISNFTFSPGQSRLQANFGEGAAFAGGTFHYPEGAEDLISDVTDDDWHLSGSVRATAGFGLFASDCRLLDLSAFAGIAFTLSGRLGAPGGLVFYVESAAQQVASAWLVDNEADAAELAPANSGRCFPESSRYDGTCREPRIVVPVRAARTEIRIAWEAFTGGSPESSIDPSEITAIAWALPEPVDGAYDIDLRIDDLRFIPR